jgi:hypothetical protein
VNLDLFGDVNWLAVIVAGAVYFAFGGLWFMESVFGKTWSRAMGWDMSEDAEGPGPELYVGPLVSCLLGSIALGLLARATDSNTAGEGVFLGLIVGIGIAGSVLFVTGVFDPKKPQPMTWFAVSAGYHVVGLVLASMILSAWQ